MATSPFWVFPCPAAPCRDPHIPHMPSLQGPAAGPDIPIQHLLSGCEARALDMPGGIYPVTQTPARGSPWQRPPGPGPALCPGAPEQITCTVQCWGMQLGNSPALQLRNVQINTEIHKKAINKVA